LNCLKSINEADWGDLRYEVIVVDNNSDDLLGDILAWQNPEVRFIQTGANLGMGGGNNVGIKQAIGDYVVVMNPDTLAERDTFQKLFAYMEINKEVGVVGPMQLNPDQSIQDSCYRWHSFLTPLYRRTPVGKLTWAQRDIDNFLMKDFDHKSIREVDWLLGSFLFCRKSALDKIGYFDDLFFMYFEDTDLCRRFWQQGYKVVYNPEVKIIHNHVRQSAQIVWYKFFTNRTARWHIASWVKYFWKWGVDKKIK
jgi:GT2 family glycosyltransferase